VYLASHRLKRALLCLVALIALLLAAATAHAEQYYTNGGAAEAARQWVASHYDVSYSDLSAACRGKNTSRPNPYLKYRRNVCAVYDNSDDTYIMIQITGQAGRGAYTAMRLSGWRRA